MRTGLIACLLVLLSSLAFAPAPAAAQERVTLGTGRLFTNDALGDGQDRWRSGAFSFSLLRGPDGTLSRPATFGELIEFRFSNRILAPANTVAPARGDRRYAGILTMGAFTHFAQDGVDYALGGELVAVGPMTGVLAFQSAAHEALGLSVPSAAVVAAQFPNAVYPSLSFEAARPVALASGAVLRPFAQLRAGDETYARLGADILIGSNFTSGVTLRDETSGQLYQALQDAPVEGFSALIGADATAVFDSVWLPEPAYSRETFYARLRTGVHYQWENVGLFYGVTYMGREFAAQPSGQLLGSLQVQIRF